MWLLLLLGLQGLGKASDSLDDLALYDLPQIYDQFDDFETALGADSDEDADLDLMEPNSEGFDPYMEADDEEALAEHYRDRRSHHADHRQEPRHERYRRKHARHFRRHHEHGLAGDDDKPRMSMTGTFTGSITDDDDEDALAAGGLRDYEPLERDSDLLESNDVFDDGLEEAIAAEMPDYLFNYDDNETPPEDSGDAAEAGLESLDELMYPGDSGEDAVGADMPDYLFDYEDDESAAPSEEDSEEDELAAEMPDYLFDYDDNETPEEPASQEYADSDEEALAAEMPDYLFDYEDSDLDSLDAPAQEDAYDDSEEGLAAEMPAYLFDYEDNEEYPSEEYADDSEDALGAAMPEYLFNYEDSEQYPELDDSEQLYDDSEDALGADMPAYLFDYEDNEEYPSDEYDSDEEALAAEMPAYLFDYEDNEEYPSEEYDSDEEALAAEMPDYLFDYEDSKEYPSEEYDSEEALGADMPGYLFEYDDSDQYPSDEYDSEEEVGADMPEYLLDDKDAYYPEDASYESEVGAEMPDYLFDSAEDSPYDADTPEAEEALGAVMAAYLYDGGVDDSPKIYDEVEEALSEVPDYKVGFDNEEESVGNTYYAEDEYPLGEEYMYADEMDDEYPLGEEYVYAEEMDDEYPLGEDYYPYDAYLYAFDSGEKAVGGSVSDAFERMFDIGAELRAGEDSSEEIVGDLYEDLYSEVPVGSRAVPLFVGTLTGVTPARFRPLVRRTMQALLQDPAFAAALEQRGEEDPVGLGRDARTIVDDIQQYFRRPRRMSPETFFNAKREEVRDMIVGGAAEAAVGEKNQESSVASKKKNKMLLVYFLKKVLNKLPLQTRVLFVKKFKKRYRNPKLRGRMLDVVGKMRGAMKSKMKSPGFKNRIDSMIQRIQGRIQNRFHETKRKATEQVAHHAVADTHEVVTVPHHLSQHLVADCHPMPKCVKGTLMKGSAPRAHVITSLFYPPGQVQHHIHIHHPVQVHMSHPVTHHTIVLHHRPRVTHHIIIHHQPAAAKARISHHVISLPNPPPVELHDISLPPPPINLLTTTRLIRSPQQLRLKLRQLRRRGGFRGLRPVVKKRLIRRRIRRKIRKKRKKKKQEGVGGMGRPHGITMMGKRRNKRRFPVTKFYGNKPVVVYYVPITTDANGLQKFKKNLLTRVGSQRRKD